MANEVQMRIIKQGAQLWNQWRKRNPAVKPNLSNADLSRMDLQEANFSLTNLTGSKFNRSNLAHANFSSANLSKASFNNADLSHSDFTRCDLGKAILRNANLTSSDFFEAKLHETNLAGANINGATLYMTSLDGAKLRLALGLTQEQLETSGGTVDTKLPDSVQMPKKWKIKPLSRKKKKS